MVPTAIRSLAFTIDGPEKTVATDNGDRTCMIAFPSPNRSAFNGLALAIVKAKKGETGKFASPFPPTVWRKGQLSWPMNNCRNLIERIHLHSFRVEFDTFESLSLSTNSTARKLTPCNLSHSDPFSHSRLRF